MARMNPRRRRMAQQQALLLSIVREHGPSHDDSYLLQRGAVRNAMNRPAVHLKGMALPRESEGFAPTWYNRNGRAKWQGDK